MNPVSQQNDLGLLIGPQAGESREYMLSDFRSDLRLWGLNVAVYNLRFNLAWTILPGVNKHIEILDED